MAGDWDFSGIVIPNAALDLYCTAGISVYAPRKNNVGAAGRGRTDTVSLPRDFESRASANSTTAAYFVVRTVSGATHANYNNISLIKNQQNLTGKRKFYE